VSSPLVRQTDVLTVLPGTVPEDELTRRLADTDGAIIMKLGRRFPAVRRALETSGRLEHALYVERASMDAERWLPVADVDPATVPYFSLIVVPGDSLIHDQQARLRLGPSVAASTTPEADLPTEDESTPTPAELLVVGLGPGPDDWLTPEVTAALAEVDHVVGYTPYVNRVPRRHGLHRHASGNTVELDRARLALDLARRGERVAVVSGGDAGVFGMAAAVFEAAEDPAYTEVHIRVMPGLSAAQAVAARVGAPLGADFAVLSLSDRLKPWAVIERRLRAAADADLVLAIYNPSSRTRATQLEEARRILLEHRPPDTVVVVGSEVGRPGEWVQVTTLADLDTAGVDMRCLVIVGASSTRRTKNGRVWSARSVAPVVAESVLE
jgi:precorrin-2 C20-methyltransferase/precorrin-3B C17-methyltransferase